MHLYTCDLHILLYTTGFNSFINMSTPFQYKPAGGNEEREEIVF